MHCFCFGGMQDMSLSKLRELVMDREAWQSMGLQRVRHDWMTELNWANSSNISFTEQKNGKIL